MKLTRHKLSILLIFTLNVLQVYCAPDNSIYKRGDQCKLDNNQSGICKEAKNCEYALQLIKDRRTSEVSRCQFEGRVPIVCCPQDAQVSVATTTAIKTTQASTTPLPLTTPSYPKSKKFINALCKNKPASLNFNKNIVNGEPADVGEFPFQVALGYRNQDNQIEYKCGGSLIADDVVVTAAHCANRRDTKPVVIKLGRTSLVPDEYDYGVGEDIEIQSIKLHSKYSRFSRHNDIALIKMKQPTKFSWPIQTICLSSDDSDLPVNYTITGYGRNDVDTRKTSDWLLRATVNLYPFDKCGDLIKLGGKILVDSQFCAIGHKGADACQGDSGGPVSYISSGTSYLYGVVSYGMACGGTIPGIYTKVNQFLEWIDDEMYKFEQI